MVEERVGEEIMGDLLVEGGHCMMGKVQSTPFLLSDVAMSY